MLSFLSERNFWVELPVEMCAPLPLPCKDRRERLVLTVLETEICQEKLPRKSKMFICMVVEKRSLSFPDPTDWRWPEARICDIYR